jgi:hypothetical protein
MVEDWPCWSTCLWKHERLVKMTAIVSAVVDTLSMKLRDSDGEGNQASHHVRYVSPSMGQPERISDWGFRSHDPDGPHGGYVSHWYYWWDDKCQVRFDQLWTSEGDIVADDLADRYWFAWPWLIGPVLRTTAPALADRIMDFAATEDRPGPAHIPNNPYAISDQIATWGAFHVVRRRRTWKEPSLVVCPVCGKDFWNGNLTVWMYRQFGPARYCEDCCMQVRNGAPQAKWAKSDVVAALSALSSALEAIPTQAFSFQILPPDAPEEQRDQWMRALVAMPTAETVKHVLGEKDWLGVLRTAGLVGDGWRSSRGTWCHARDGHRCRSLLEKSIDDWFSSHGIAHECEPYWPPHPLLNPSGRKRADWLLDDGTYVECAGMMEEPDYAIKIAHKRELAHLLNIPLYVIGPTDLQRLDRIFATHLDHARPRGETETR